MQPEARSEASITCYADLNMPTGIVSKATSKFCDRSKALQTLPRLAPKLAKVVQIITAQPMVPAAVGPS